MNKVNSDEEKETKIEYLESCLKTAEWNFQEKDDSLKKAWTRINYLERREAELVGLLSDALQGAKITPADLICSACGSACGTPRGVAHDLDLSDCCLAKIVA